MQFTYRDRTAGGEGFSILGVGGSQFTHRDKTAFSEYIGLQIRVCQCDSVCYRINCHRENK